MKNPEHNDDMQNICRHCGYDLEECKCNDQTKCLQCPKKLPKYYVELFHSKKFCSMKCLEKYIDKWEMMIHKHKALEARKKRSRLEGENINYATKPKNNGLVKEKKVSFIKKVVEIIKCLKP
jgi:hypothetical protein